MKCRARGPSRRADPPNWRKTEVKVNEVQEQQEPVRVFQLSDEYSIYKLAHNRKYHPPIYVVCTLNGHHVDMELDT